MTSFRVQFMVGVFPPYRHRRGLYQRDYWFVDRPRVRFFRLADAIIMRIMDSMMAILHLAGHCSRFAQRAEPLVRVGAITIPEVPRVVRLVRSVVLSAREEPYVEAAIALGTSMPKILLRHLMPNTLAPLIVQGTYICASAILTEALLSFLGAGVSTEIPTWGNIMAEGRVYFQIKPSLIFWPGLMLSLCILSINLLGDSARTYSTAVQEARPDRCTSSETSMMHG